MRFKLKTWLSAAAAIVITSGIAWAANTTLSNLSASGALAGANTLYVVQTPGAGGVKATFTQVATYINSLFSGDATVASGGALTLATVNGNVGTFGSATSCITTTQNAKGLTTAISAATCTPAIGSITGLGTGVASALAAAMNSSTGPVGALTATNGNCIVAAGSAWTSAACPGGTAANPTATAGPTAVNGVASTYMRSDGAPAIQQGSSSVKGIVQVDGTTITATGGVISAVGGGSSSAVPSVQTGTNYAFQGTDLTKVIYLSNAANQTPTIAQAGTGSFTSGWYATVCNIAAGTQTITTTTSTIAGIAGATGYVLPAGSVAAPKCIGLVSDGTNYVIVPDYFRFGTGVETAAGLALSAAGGLTTTLATGTATLGTSAIASGACATTVSPTATGAASTDKIGWSPNADISAVTGYAPVTTGGLIIYPWASTNTVNFKICNPTSSSITPGAVTLNWAIHR